MWTFLLHAKVTHSYAQLSHTQDLNTHHAPPARIAVAPLIHTYASPTAAKCT